MVPLPISDRTGATADGLVTYLLLGDGLTHVEDVLATSGLSLIVARLFYEER